MTCPIRRPFIRIKVGKLKARSDTPVKRDFNLAAPMRRFRARCTSRGAARKNTQGRPHPHPFNRRRRVRSRHRVHCPINGRPCNSHDYRPTQGRCGRHRPS